jgi:hypothetical protein
MSDLARVGNPASKNVICSPESDTHEHIFALFFWGLAADFCHAAIA